jgi:uncharacterized protein
MANALRAFLEDRRRPSGTLRYHELQGFLFAVASAPELVTPSEWIPAIFDDQQPEYESVDEATTVMSELVAVYYAINAPVREHRPALPSDCRFRDDVLANLDDNAPIAQLSRGFVQGHQWLEESWDPYVPEELDDDVGAMLMTLSFFSSRAIAEAFCTEAKEPNLTRLASTLRRVFPRAMAEYAGLGESIQQAINEANVQAAKVGRNDPCPCGSGRKYKKCCGGQ